MRAKKEAAAAARQNRTAKVGQPTPSGGHSAGPSWSEYLADCGLKAQEANEAKTEKTFREKYKGKTVQWSGFVDAIKESTFGDGYVVFIRMKPTDSALGLPDLSLSVRATLQDKMLELKKEQQVKFSGILERQGGRITGHDISVNKIEVIR